MTRKQILNFIKNVGHPDYNVHFIKMLIAHNKKQNELKQDKEEDKDLEYLDWVA